MLKKSYLLLLVTALSICLSTVTANAVTIFSDLGPAGNLYDSTSAWSVYDVPMYGWLIEPASQFTAGGGTPGDSLNVAQIDVAVDQRFTSYPGTFQVKIWTSAFSAALGYDIPGSVLYTSPVLTPIGLYQSSGNLVAVSGITGLSLTAGQEYFMSVNAVTGSDAAWYRNSQGVTGLVLDSFDHEATWPGLNNPVLLPAFDILGTSAPVTAVPEPSTILLLGLGLTGLAARYFRKNKS